MEDLGGGIGGSESETEAVQVRIGTICHGFQSLLGSR